MSAVELNAGEGLIRIVCIYYHSSPPTIFMSICRKQGGILGSVGVGACKAMVSNTGQRSSGGGGCKGSGICLPIYAQKPPTTPPSRHRMQ